MLVSQPVRDEGGTRQGGSFGDALTGKAKEMQIAAKDIGGMPDAKDFSGGGLPAPDGYTRDPFPPSMAAYVDILRSVAEYLRQQGRIGGGDAETVVEKIAVKDEPDVAEPTTFAIGEEEHDCAVPVSTPAIGEAVPA